MPRQPYPEQNVPANRQRRRTPDYIVRLPQRRAAAPSRATLFLGLTFLGLMALILGALALVVGSYFYYQSSGRILPGVHVGGVQLGGMTRLEAVDYLDQTWNHQKKILASNGIQFVEVAPAEVGLTLDAQQTAQRAHNVGHGGTILAEMAQMFASATQGLELKPVVTLDEDLARQGLENLAGLLSQPAKDAGLRVTDGHLEPVPYELGYTINIDATLDALRKRPQDVLSGGVLQVQPQPVIPAVTDVTPAMQQAQRLLDSSVNVNAYDPINDEHIQWAIPREALAAWLKVEAGPNGPQVALDENGVADYLTHLGESLGTERYLNGAAYAAALAQAVRDGKDYAVIISHRPTRYTVQSGDTLLKVGWNVGMPYWKILNANPEIDPDAIAAGTELVVPSKDELLPLPVVPNKRVVINITRQHMWVYQDGQRINSFVISTGIDRSPTQPGIFQIQTHDPQAYASVWDLTMPNFLGIYEAWPGFMNGIHGLPTLSSGQRLWANILGSPASYGCIILDLPAADWLYNWAEDGVVVEIQP